MLYLRAKTININFLLKNKDNIDIDDRNDASKISEVNNKLLMLIE